MKTATEITLNFDSKHRFFPIAGYDPLQELLAGTFYTTMAREYSNDLARFLASPDNH